MYLECAPEPSGGGIYGRAARRTERTASARKCGGCARVTARYPRGTGMSKFVPICPAVLSIIGWHAGELVEDIVRRKCADIAKIGSTLWVYQSWKARVQDVQKFGSVFPNPTVYFLEGKAFPAGTEHKARQMSVDRKDWVDLPTGIGKVTGKLPGGAFVIGSLSSAHDHKIDLWDYVEHPDMQPMKFQQGASTLCASPTQDGKALGMKSHIRDVVAIGRLAPPYAVFLQASSGVR